MWPRGGREGVLGMKNQESRSRDAGKYLVLVRSSKEINLVEEMEYLKIQFEGGSLHSIAHA